MNRIWLCIALFLCFFSSSSFAQSPPSLLIGPNCPPVNYLTAFPAQLNTPIQITGVGCVDLQPPIAIDFISSDPLATLPAAQTFTVLPTLQPLPTPVSLGAVTFRTPGPQSLTVREAATGRVLNSLPFNVTPVVAIFSIGTSCVRPGAPLIPLPVQVNTSVAVYGVRCGTGTFPVPIAFQSSDPLASLPPAQSFPPSPTVPEPTLLGTVVFRATGLQVVNVTNSSDGTLIDQIAFQVSAASDSSTVPMMGFAALGALALLLGVVARRSLRRIRPSV